MSYHKNLAVLQLLLTITTQKGLEKEITFLFTFHLTFKL